MKDASVEINNATDVAIKETTPKVNTKNKTATKKASNASCDIPVNLKKFYSSSISPTEFTDHQPYTTRVPEWFAPGSDFQQDWEKKPYDKLMFDLITNYAKEGKKDSDGKPSNKFFVNRDAMKKVVKPYVEKYLPEVGKDT